MVSVSVSVWLTARVMRMSRKAVKDDVCSQSIKLGTLTTSVIENCVLFLPQSKSAIVLQFFCSFTLPRFDLSIWSFFSNLFFIFCLSHRLQDKLLTCAHWGRLPYNWSFVIVVVKSALSPKMFKWLLMNFDPTWHWQERERERTIEFNEHTLGWRHKDSCLNLMLFS